MFDLNTNFNALDESYIARIPVIGGVTNLDIRNDKITYKTVSDFKLINDKLATNNFFVSMVKMALKKAVLTSSKKLQLKYHGYIKNKFKKKYRIKKSKFRNSQVSVKK